MAETRAGPVRPQEEERALNALLFQPGANLIQRLAARVGLTANGLTLGGRPGERVVFGASGALRNALAADGSWITFATEAELLGHWVCVLDGLLTRDWSWDGLRDEGIAFHRRDKPANPHSRLAGFNSPFAVGPLAVADDADERSQTRIVFFDAIDPKPPLGSFPEVITPEWQITPRFRGLADNVGDAVAKTLAVRLPVAVAPRQTPKLVSAGIALSDYSHDGTYSSTEARKRVLSFRVRRASFRPKRRAVCAGPGLRPRSTSFRRYHAAPHPSPRRGLRANDVVRYYRKVPTRAC